MPASLQSKTPEAIDSPALAEIRSRLRDAARPENKAILQRYFKTGPGEYGEGDQFLGVRVPEVRRLVRTSDSLAVQDVLALLRSPIHEERLLALHILVRRFERGDETLRESIVALYLREILHINNWDLVDSSAHFILGAWLLPRDRSLLRELAGSQNLWERRVAMISTFAFIRSDDLAWTFDLAVILLDDDHDLMHKAVGWMLREAGKRNAAALRDFLETHAARMPRTMLRYAIEKLPAPERAAWLARPRDRFAAS